MISPDHRIVLRPGTREERQYVELFCNQTSRAMSGFFSSQFWNYLLPQLSYSQPAVRHAIAAVSAIYEQQFLHTPSSLPARSVEQIRNEHFVLQQYNKAIKHLTEGFPSSEQSLDLTLITCCLFACLEMLRGNFKQALDHLEAGLRILCRRQKSLVEWGHGLKSVGGSEVIEQELSCLFARFNVQLSLFGRPLAPFEPPASDTSLSEAMFSTILEARYSLDRLMNKGLRFIRSVSEARDTLHRMLLLQEQFEIKRELNDWSTAFENMMKTQARRTTKKLDQRGPLLLRIHHRVIKIWLETCLAADQTAFDKHSADFATIVSNATLVMRNHNGSESDDMVDDDQPTDNFCLDMGIVPPLYFTATKCRHPILRREAIDLLSAYPRQEGMWHPRQCAKIGELVVAVEEAQVSSLPVELRVPEDRDRVYEAIMPDDNNPNPFPVVLYSKPGGVYGAWNVRTEYIQW